MNWNKGIRQTHRWLSFIFILLVIFIMIAFTVQEQPAEWLYYSPLPLLFLLMLTGLYLFVLPYVAKRRSERQTD